MEECDQQRFAELMAGLAQTFATELSVRDMENYWRFLRPYPLLQIEQAVLTYCTSPDGHRFMPKPGELVAALSGKENERSLMAWIKVTHAIKKAGAYRTVIFDDEIIHAVIHDLGGWIHLCQLSGRDLVFQQKEFERLYVCYLHQRFFHYPRQLTGVFDQENTAAGYLVPQKPSLFGDPVRAALVFKNGQISQGSDYRSLSVSEILKLANDKNAVNCHSRENENPALQHNLQTCHSHVHCHSRESGNPSTHPLESMGENTEKEEQKI